jgi:tripartite-type tricarboxylate transporter receptor subunit TctC
LNRTVNVLNNQNNILALERVRKGPPNGNTIFVGGTEVVRAAINSRENASNIAEPVALVASIPVVVVIQGNRKLTIDDLVKSSAAPMTLKMATPTDYFSSLLAKRLKLLARAQIVSVTGYKGSGDILVAVQSGEIDIAVVSFSAAQGALRTTALRALATTELVPDTPLQGIPTIGQIGMPQLQNFVGTFVAPGTPGDAVGRLNKAMNTAIGSASGRLRELGLVPKGGTPGVLRSAVEVISAAMPDVCKVKEECEKDPVCPRPCPDK